MIGVVITSHGSMCQGIVQSAEMIIGPQDGVWTVPLTEEGIKEYEEQLQAVLNEARACCEGVIVLADIAHATPFNCSYRYLLEHDDGSVQLLCGYNLPLVVELLMSRSDGVELASFASEMLEVGKSSLELAVTEFEAEDVDEEF